MSDATVWNICLDPLNTFQDASVTFLEMPFITFMAQATWVIIVINDRGSSLSILIKGQGILMYYKHTRMWGTSVKVIRRNFLYKNNVILQFFSYLKSFGCLKDTFLFNETKVFGFKLTLVAL